VSDVGECFILGGRFKLQPRQNKDILFKIPQKYFNNEPVVLTTAGAHTAVFFTEKGHCFGVRVSDL
jgi:formate dehydrogenase assembly factor FdhD